MAESKTQLEIRIQQNKSARNIKIGVEARTTQPTFILSN